ncbi:hypothetical protein EDD52_11080 [Primorskyibacter sedentarius]|uniref:Uncharacterized protein n=1 Tax=Primorskyibacter sedentarius TaxID=745311 RepID=A0A4R3JA31_9RHOB|nr:hypothetical protein EDD52_11080 [Primorskyibacter sedentarius]
MWILERIHALDTKFTLTLTICYDQTFQITRRGGAGAVPECMNECAYC